MNTKEKLIDNENTFFLGTWIFIYRDRSFEQITLNPDGTAFTNIPFLFVFRKNILGRWFPKGRLERKPGFVFVPKPGWNAFIYQRHKARQRILKMSGKLMVK